MSPERHQAELYVQRHALDLSVELPFLTVPRNKREVMVLGVPCAGGQIFWGEVAPLPGFSRESLDDAERELRDVLPRVPVLDHTALSDISAWESLIAEVRSPALRCGFEGALLEYLMSHDSWALSHIIHQTILSNALIVAKTEDEAVERIAEAERRGFRSIKLKVTPESWRAVVSAMKRSRNRGDSEVSFRLDGNRSLSRGEFEELAEQSSELPIEYVEEPLRDIQDIPHVITSTSLSLALDETAREVSRDQWQAWGIRHVVLKPALQGGWISLGSEIRSLEREGITVTLSSSFESGLGLRSIVLMAALHETSSPIGVDTASFMNRDLVAPRFPVNSPVLDVETIRKLEYVGRGTV